jgi:NAD(P)H-hydrate epimerase
MREVDERAADPVEVLIERAGTAVARTALQRMGGAYGRRVVVIAGKGNNGADGRAAADVLRARGARVTVIDAADAVPRVPPCDLVIDAAYGTGFRGSYDAPDPAGAPVLAVDIPSGIDGLTGEASWGAVRADATVTFAALKPGVVLSDRCGVVDVVDIGLDVSGARIHVVEDADVVLPARGRDAHKWQSAVLVVAGSPGMTGAPLLVARGAIRAGAGYVRLAVGDGADMPPGSEAVAVPRPSSGWAEALASDLERCRAVVVGPGLGRGDDVTREVRSLLGATDKPVVVDADGLNALAGDAAGVLSQRRGPTVLTPHDGEFARLAGEEAGADRIAEARALSAATGSVVLLKGSTTVVARPDGRVLLAVAGGPQLATAGTGDVLSGVIGAFLAQGLDEWRAAAFAAHVHGAASRLGFARGLVAGDLPDLIATWLSAHA